MRNCPDLAAEVKKRRASRLSVSVNVVDNSCDDGLSDSSNEFPVVLEHYPPLDDELALAINVAELNLASSSERKKREEWFLDSGASKHGTGLKHALTNLTGGNGSQVGTAGGEKLLVAG